MTRNRTRTVRATLVGAVALLLAVGITLLYSEAASVQLSIAPQKIEAIVALSAALTGGALRSRPAGRKRSLVEAAAILGEILEGRIVVHSYSSNAYSRARATPE